MLVEAPLFVPPHEAQWESGGKAEGVTVVLEEIEFAEAKEERSFEGWECF